MSESELSKMERDRIIWLAAKYSIPDNELKWALTDPRTVSKVQKPIDPEILKTAEERLRQREQDELEAKKRRWNLLTDWYALSRITGNSIRASNAP